MYVCEGARLSTEMHNHNFSSRSIVIGCNTVEWVNTYKRLVVIISDDLRWVHHNEYISKKASKHLYSLRILERVGVASDSILRVCLTIFRPILEYGVIYCNEVNKRSLFIYLFSRGAIPLELVYTRQMSVCSATTYEAIDNSTKQLGPSFLQTGRKTKFTWLGWPYENMKNPRCRCYSLKIVSR